MAGNVVCSKCGATGGSKCAVRRLVFPDNQRVTILEYILSARLEGERLIVEHKIIGDAPLEARLRKLGTLIDSLTDKDLKELVCCHDWQQAPGTTCLFGCCNGSPIPDREPMVDCPDKAAIV